MNLVKGFDRMALVIALIALIPDFFLGVEFCDEFLKTKSHEYKVWEKKYIQRKMELENEIKALSESELLSRVNELKQRPHKNWLFNISVSGYERNAQDYYVDWHLYNLDLEKPSKRYRYIYPSRLQTILGSIIFSLFTSFILLLFLRGLIRGVRWMVKGFKN